MDEKLKKIRNAPSEDEVEEEISESGEEEKKLTKEFYIEQYRKYLKYVSYDPVYVDCLDEPTLKYTYYAIHSKKFKSINSPLCFGFLPSIEPVRQKNEDVEEEEEEISEDQSDDNPEVRPDDGFSIPTSQYYIKSEVPKKEKKKVTHPKWGLFHKCVPLHILDNLPEAVQDDIIQNLKDNVPFGEICDNLVIPNMGDMLDEYINPKQ